MSQKTISGFYEHDHDDLDSYLKEYQRLKTTQFDAAKESFKKFKFGLQRHIFWEEMILFPLFEEKTGMKNEGPTAVMRIEHRKIGEALEQLHNKVRARNTDSEQEEKNLISILSEHNAKEESILYPMLDNISSEEERAGVFQKMERTEEKDYKTCGCCTH
ncbi:MAG: hemerythrin domain-containing protein [Deltaproteobacteria bacterium]|nr:hemerythrin domain-containing protein [Deltaproteobacteria bacterium]